MPAIEFPRSRVVALQELAARVLDSRELGCANETLARDLLVGFYDVCMRSGLDNVLVELANVFPPLDVTDRVALADHADLRAVLVEKLGHKLQFDDGGPRNAKPRQLGECLVASLGLTLTDEPDRTLTLSDDVRTQVMTALTSVIDVEFTAAQLRANVIAKARELCDPRYHDTFDRIAAQLDDRGMHIVRQPKVPLDASQAVQHVLFEARNAVIERAASAAFDRAKQELGRANAEAAKRIDQPITHRLTPRAVAILRVSEPRVPKVAASVVLSLFDTLTELAHLAWSPLEKPVRAYAASQTYAVGDQVEHPKFGRGSVKTSVARRIEVEFADGKHTLAHAGTGKY